MERRLPSGRDLSLLHNLYSYVLAYSYRAARAAFPRLTLHEFCCYAPPVLFAATAALFMAVLWTLFGWEAAGLGSLFLIFVPAIGFRTALSFADRDAFCIFLGVLTGALYLWQASSSSDRRRNALAAACGVAACLGCLAWEGSGVFALCVLIPSTVGALRSTDRVTEFYVFAACLTLPLLLFSSAHRFWIVPSEPAHPVGLIAVYPALLVLSLVLIRHALKSRLHIGLKASSFIPAALLAGFLIRRILVSGEAAVAFAVPLSNSRLMQSVTELRDMDAERWKMRFSGLPIITAAGVVGSLARLFWKRGRGISAAETVLFATGGVCIWGYLTMGAIRYAVMLAPAVASVSAVTLVWIGKAIQQKKRQRKTHSESRASLTKSDASRLETYGFTAREALRYIYVTLIPMTILYWGACRKNRASSCGSHRIKAAESITGNGGCLSLDQQQCALDRRGFSYCRGSLGCGQPAERPRRRSDDYRSRLMEALLGAPVV